MTQPPAPSLVDWASMRQWITGNIWGVLPEGAVVKILLSLMERLVLENNILTVRSPAYIVGDIHGQLDDLLWLFGKAGALPIPTDEAAIMKSGTSKPVDYTRPLPFTANQNFLFMGDYVDRGSHSLHTFLYLACLKLELPDRIFLLRGNHESRQVSTRYGFYQECIQYYGHPGLWTLCNEAFDLLPVAALVDRDVFCVHGGLSPKLPLVEMISMLERQVEIPQTGSLADLCWSDPENVPAWRENTRGSGYLFGPQEATKFTRINRIDFIARSHQLAQTGFAEYFAESNHPFRLVTVWSAPNYSRTSGNRASILGFKIRDRPRHEYVLFDAAPEPLQIRETTATMASPYFS